MSEETKTATAAEVLAKAQAAKEAAAKPQETESSDPAVEVALSDTAYQLPIAPATVAFRDKNGKKYSRIFPEGVAVPETAEEKETLEAMLAVGNCYRAVEGPKSAFQKTPPPVGSK